MLVPLGVLTLGAIAAGYVFKYPFVETGVGAAFWAGSLAFNDALMTAVHEVPTWVKWSSTVAMLIGLGTAIYMYLLNPRAPEQVAAAVPPLYRFFLHKWYFDEIYDWLFVKPAFALGRIFWKSGDVGVIDRFGPNGVAALVKGGSVAAARFQTGYLYSYALVMLIGLVGLVSWVMVR